MIVIAIVIMIFFFLLKKKKEEEKKVYLEETKTVDIMHASDQVKSFLEKEEGNKLVPYPDSGGWSVGRGHYLGNNKGLPITEEMSDRFFDEDIKECEDYLASKITRPISQGLYDMLIELAFNTGGDFGQGLINLVNTGADIEKIKAKVREYSKSGKPLKTNPVILARRERGIKTFLT